MDILEKIIADTKLRNEHKWRGFQVDKALEVLSQVDARIPLRPALLDDLYKSHEELYLILEIKKASPSQGIICDSFNPLSIAKSYVEGGADAISILTEETFFKGSLTHLKMVRNYALNTPLLRKDFIVHPYQVYETYEYGADLVLLIVAALQDDMLAFLYEYIESFGMTALVEVHTQEELERALKINPKVIGINNRDLRSFEVRLSTTIQLISMVPKGIKVISESGIFTDIDVVLLQTYGIHGILVGQSVLESDDPKRKIESFKRYKCGCEQ